MKHAIHGGVRHVLRRVCRPYVCPILFRSCAGCCDDLMCFSFRLRQKEGVLMF